MTHDHKHDEKTGGCCGGDKNPEQEQPKKESGCCGGDKKDEKKPDVEKTQNGGCCGGSHK